MIATEVYRESTTIEYFRLSPADIVTSLSQSTLIGWHHLTIVQLAAVRATDGEPLWPTRARVDSVKTVNLFQSTRF